MEQNNSDLSTFNVCFGQKICEPTPIDISANLDFFSQKSENMKFNLAGILNIEIPENSLVVSIIPKNMSSEQFAQKFKNSQMIQKLIQQVPVNIDIHHKNDKVHFVLSGQDISMMLSQYEEMFAHLSGQASGDESTIALKVQSRNDFKTVSQTLIEKNGPQTLLDSLQVSLSFIKTEVVIKVLQTVLQNMLGMPNLIPMIHSFKKLNLECNFASAKQFDNYPKLKFHKNTFKDKMNDFVQLLKDSDVETGSFNVFNKTISLSGNLNLIGLQFLLGVVFQ